MMVTKQADGRPIKMWLKPVPNGSDPRDGESPDVEDKALEQLRQTARLPFLHPHGLVAMPDVHYGIGATIGSVVATRKAIVPAAVGVDIACGMCAVRTTLTAEDLPDTLEPLRRDVERSVPSGTGGQHRDDNYVSASAWHNDLADRLAGLRLDERGIGTRNVWKQMGTLGSGNHFVEFCLDEGGRVWVMLHSGSRGIGNQIGRRYTELAKRECERWHVPLPHQDLAYLPEGTPLFDEYWNAMAWAQDYARENRAAMMAAALRSLAFRVRAFDVTGEAINCHHNYAARESHFGENVIVTRKGAVRARAGDLGIVPGSMGTRSYIVRGKGCAESYHSCAHGAGRRMSRSEARRRYTAADLAAQTDGVECRKDDAVVDEIPAAYKDIDEVMALQADLVDVVHVLKQVCCIKGA